MSLPIKNTDYNLLPTSPQKQQQSNLRSSLVFRRIFTLRNFVFTVFALVVFAIFANGGFPALYTDIRMFEQSLPQHNVNLSISLGIRYLAFPHHIWGHGWNNILQVYLMLSYLAYITNRSYVFDDYIWSQSPLPYTIYDFALRPSRIPLNAFISGPIAGGPFQRGQRAVHINFWQSICPQEKRRVLNFSDNIPKGIWGRSRVQWWKDTIEEHEDATCLEIVTHQEPVIYYTFFEGQEFLDIWPSLSQTPILTNFKWSPLVISAVERNFALFSDRRDTSVNFPPEPDTQRHDLSIEQELQKVSPSAPTDSYPRLLALHIRRGDYIRHCNRLAYLERSFQSFNSFDDHPDRWIPYNDSLEVDKYEWYRKRCFLTQDEIVKRLHIIRDEYDAFLADESLKSNTTRSVTIDGTSPNPQHRLTRIFVLSNAWPLWLESLRNKLFEDGWEDIVFGGDLVFDKPQRGVSVAVDMSIAEKAEVFVGNGFSSLTANIATLRTVKGLHKQTNRLL